VEQAGNPGVRHERLLLDQLMTDTGPTVILSAALALSEVEGKDLVAIAAVVLVEMP